MKILLLIPELGYGGAEGSLLRLAGQLARHHEITLAVFSKSYQDSTYTKREISVPFQLLEMDRNLSLPSYWLPSLVVRWWHRAQQLNRLKKHHAICISFLSGANLLNALVRAGKPCVLSVRGTKWYDSDQSLWKRYLWCCLLDPLAYSRADRIITVSEGLSQEVCKALPIRRRPIVQAIMGYLDGKEALNAASVSIEPEFESLRNTPLLVAAGRLHHQKGFQFLLPLFAQAAAAVPGSKLLLIGDGPLKTQLLEQAMSLQLRVDCPRPDQLPDPNAQLILLGFRPQPARYTQLGRAFVFPSLYEGLPNMLLEALVAGSWCLAADCPWGPSEILADPNLGQLLPPIENHVHHTIWVEALISALQRPDGLRLSMPMRRSVVRRFSIESSGQRWLEMLHELLS